MPSHALACGGQRDDQVELGKVVAPILHLLEGPRAVAAEFDAKLLAEALHLALEYVTDQTKPLWMRTDALVGIGVTTILLVVIVVVAGRVDG